MIVTVVLISVRYIPKIAAAQAGSILREHYEIAAWGALSAGRGVAGLDCTSLQSINRRLSLVPHQGLIVEDTEINSILGCGSHPSHCSNVVINSILVGIVVVEKFDLVHIELPLRNGSSRT